MLTYKYSIDEVYDRPLVPEKDKRREEEFVNHIHTASISTGYWGVLLLYSPIKAIQILIEKFSDEGSLSDYQSERSIPESTQEQEY
ncbi:MAG: hypothetical protein IPN18_07790 [Ignavibacteriales bacterium]|nr:hypothetical protein [Ignavibacteriales bacterium]